MRAAVYHRFGGPEVVRVEEVPKPVPKPGDQIIAMPGPEFAAHAEYKVMRETVAITPKPRNLDLAEAVTIAFGGQPALVFLRRGGPMAGDEVLVNGASGSVGSAAVMIAKGLGATVTGVCSGANVEFVRSLGTDHVIDYQREDFATAGRQYDAIIADQLDAEVSR